MRGAPRPTMTETIKIRPAVTHIVTANGRSAVSEVHLGGAPRGAVIILGGYQKHRIDSVEVMNSLAGHGYESLYAPTPDSSADRGEKSPSGLPAEDLAAHLRQRGWSRDQIGILGFGHGGVAALQAAGERDYGAAISVCPNVGMSATTTLLNDVRTPWLAIFSDLGPLRGAIADAMERQRRSSSAFTQVVEYRDCRADFYWEPKGSTEYAASFDARQRIVEWLNLRVARPTARPAMWRKQPKSPTHADDPMREGPFRCPSM